MHVNPASLDAVVPAAPPEVAAPLPTGPASLHAKLKPLFNDDASCDRHERNVVLLNAALFVHLAIVTLGWLPGWTMLLTVPSIFVRWLNTVHEVSHLRGPDKVNWVVRLHPLLTGPFTAGFREMRIEHMAHHHYAITPQDPTMYLVAGSNFRGLLAALTSPEQLLARAVLERGFDRQLTMEMSLRFVLFVAVGVLCGPAFAWYLVAVRLAYAAAFFAFFRAIHRRGPEMGIYETQLPWIGRAFLFAAFGTEAKNAILHHDIHHAHALVAAARLEDARQVLRADGAAAA